MTFFGFLFYHAGVGNHRVIAYSPRGFPVTTGCSCPVWRLNMFNLKPATYPPLQTFPEQYDLSVPSHACWRQC